MADRPVEAARGETFWHSANQFGVWAASWMGSFESVQNFARLEAVTPLDELILSFASATVAYQNGSEQTKSESVDRIVTAWGRVLNDVGTYFSTNGWMRGAGAALAGTSLWLAPRTFLGTACISLIVFHNCQRVTGGLKPESLQRWDKAICAISMLTGVTLIGWQLKGVGMVDGWVHWVASTLVSLTTGGAAGLWLAQCGTLGDGSAYRATAGGGDAATRERSPNAAPPAGDSSGPIDAARAAAAVAVDRADAAVDLAKRVAGAVGGAADAVGGAADAVTTAAPAIEGALEDVRGRLNTGGGRRPRSGSDSAAITPA